MITQFNFPTEIQFGVNSISLLAPRLKKENLNQILLVSDSIISNLDFFKEIKTSLEKEGLKCKVYNNFSGNPLKSHVEGGAEAAREFQADCVIGIGGGAALDVSKVVALMTHHPGDLFDYEDGLENSKPVDQKMPFIIAIPTTAGTGSEVGRSSVVSDDKTHAKKIIFSPRILPNLVIADPELTLDLPSKVTAATGLDALTHCVEAYLAKGYHPMCDGIALEGISLISKFLVKATKNGNDLEARTGMLMAALMGAVAFQKGLGVCHSLAHSLSTVCDLHHGLANGIMLPYAMEFNEHAVPEKFKTMAKAVGCDDFIQWIRDLREELEIPNKLNQVGVKATQHLEPLIAFAMKDVCLDLGPRTPSEDDVKQLFQTAL